jgi:hypothetical protein
MSQPALKHSFITSLKYSSTAKWKMMSGTSDFKIRAPVLQRRAEADAPQKTPETRRHCAVARKKAMVDIAQLEPPKKIMFFSLEFGRIIDHLYRFQSGI